jgi:hypothetical protein
MVINEMEKNKTKLTSILVMSETARMLLILDQSKGGRAVSVINIISEFGSKWIVLM